MTLYQYPDYLMHHGVKGMRWGHRRYQNEDGSLTLTGKKRLKYDEAKKTKKSAEINFAKRELRDAKIHQKLAGKDKSKHQKKLEEKYQKQGFSKKDAEIQAYKRIRTERALLVAGGMTAAALAAYALNEQKHRNIDQFIKSDSLLGRVDSDNNKSVYDAFYAYEDRNIHDKNRYQGMYGLQTHMMGRDVYTKNIRVGESGIKVASPNNAKKAMSELIRDDPEYKDTVKTLIRRNVEDGIYGPKQKAVQVKALHDLNNNRITDSVYDAVNTNLVWHDPTSERANQKFYNKLRESGYQAIKDMNDSKHSGYKAKNPLIVFDKSKVIVESVSKRETSEVISKGVAESGKIVTEQLIEDYSIPIAGLATTGIMVKRTSNNRKVRAYKRKHPNTKLSYNKILKIYDEGDGKK
mgnify:FL=1